MTQVLVVGAGPTGTILAARLASAGVDVRLVDRLAEPLTTSRAFTVHARTLELLAGMGLADAFVERGLRTTSMDYHFPTKDEVPRLDFRELDSLHDYCLTIDQADTERLLREHAERVGAAVEWRTTLESLREVDGGVEADLDVDGTPETVRVDWLVGCDGHASRVRELLEVPFDGTDYEGTMRMMDVEVDGLEVSDDAIHYFIAKDHMLLVNKLPGPNHRVLVSDKRDRVEQLSAEDARDEFQEVVDRHFDGSVSLGTPVWNTSFRISKRQVNAYRQGRVLLAGDAAHVNSPAGGQGMNVAMQDAFNLAWKLALVLRGEAAERLIDTYAEERAPVAQQMLEGTSHIHSIVMAHGQGMQERIERLEADGWNKRAVSQIAGISYTYADRPESSEVEPTAELLAGDRAPDARLPDGSRLHEHLSADGFTLLWFAPDAAAAASAAEASTRVAGSFAAPMHVCMAVPDAVEVDLDGVDVVAATPELRKRYGAGDDGRVVVVRPDGHVSLLGAPDDVDGLVAHLGDTLLTTAAAA